MKKSFLRSSAFFSCILLSLLLLAGPVVRAQRGERIHAIKVGYLTDRLRLSADQATAFWPLYDHYEDDIRSARIAFRQRRQQAGQPSSEAAATKIVDDDLDYQEEVLTINKRYRDRFLKVISAQQLATLYEAERDFRKLLLQQLRDRRAARNER